MKIRFTIFLHFFTKIHCFLFRGEHKILRLRKMMILKKYYKYKSDCKKISFLLYLSLSVTYLFAGNPQSSIIKPEYGQQLFKKKLRRLCKRTAPNFAQIHTVSEWKMLKKSNNFHAEIYKICPKTMHHLKQEWIEPLYLFAVTYARDTKKYTE